MATPPPLVKYALADDRLPIAIAVLLLPAAGILLPLPIAIPP